MMKELDDIPKTNPFRVPEGYFENLSEKIIQKSANIPQVQEKRAVIRRLRPLILAAASVAILATAGYVALNLAGKAHERKMTALLSDYSYSSIYLNDIDIATLEESIPDNETFVEIPQVTSNEIIDYLVSEDVSLLDIYEQL